MQPPWHFFNWNPHTSSGAPQTSASSSWLKSPSPPWPPSCSGSVRQCISAGPWRSGRCWRLRQGRDVGVTTRWPGEARICALGSILKTNYIQRDLGIEPIFLVPDDPWTSVVEANEEAGGCEFEPGLCRFLLPLGPWWFLPPCCKVGLGASRLSASAPVRRFI